MCIHDRDADAGSIPDPDLACSLQSLFYIWRFFYLARERISKSTQPNPLFRNSFFRGMNWNQSGSIRNITAHLINDKNTSIAETCIVFNGKSAGNNPRWIYWSYEFLFFRPWGLWTWRPAQTRPRGQNLRFPRFDPMILCSFLTTIR